MSPPKLKQLLLLRGRSLCRGDRLARPDLAGGSGSREISLQAPGRAPRPLPRSIGFSSFKNHGSGEAKLLVAIHSQMLVEPETSRKIPHSRFIF